jgi:hypothetical protein
LSESAAAPASRCAALKAERLRLEASQCRLPGLPRCAGAEAGASAAPFALGWRLLEAGAGAGGWCRAGAGAEAEAGLAPVLRQAEARLSTAPEMALALVGASSASCCASAVWRRCHGAGAGAEAEAGAEC